MGVEDATAEDYEELYKDNDLLKVSDRPPLPIGSSGKNDSTKKIINFQNFSDDNLDRNLPRITNLPDNIISVAQFFLRAFETNVRIKNDNKTYSTKKTNLYYSILNLLRVREIKILTIDYQHFVDWCDIYVHKITQMLTKYNLQYPYIDLNRLEDYEKFDLAVYMYSKKLLEYLDGPNVARFCEIMRLGAFQFLQAEFGIDLESDPETRREFKELHISIKNFPVEKDIHEINSTLLKRGVCVKGNLVSYDDKRRVEIVKSFWSCNNCNYITSMEGATRPLKCSECGERAGFQEHSDKFENIDFIYIKIQQHLNSDESQVGVTDLVIKIQGNNLISQFFKKMKPAAALKVTGVVSLSHDKQNKNNPNERLLQQEALTIEVENENNVIQYNDRLLDIIATKLSPDHIEAHFEKLIRSICPHIYGQEAVKKGMLLMYAGAEPRVHSDSKHRVKGDINILLVGDPSMAKSEYGWFTIKVIPQSIRTVGGKATTTKAALTTSVDIVGGIRVVTFGVLALCDKRGIAIIDELDKREKEDFEILSIPMDDNQTIPTHKSGFHQDVMARCPVLLIGNPNKNGGRWDPSKRIEEQTNFASWLTSRVDLIFVLYDDGNMERKEKMLDHISESRQRMVVEGDYEKNYKNKTYSELSIEKVENDLVNNKFDGVYDTEYLRHELHYLKNTYKPMIKSKSTAEKKIKKEWLKFSTINIPIELDGEDANKTNPMMDARKINSLERLSMAAARLRRHHYVMDEDVDTAVNIMMHSMTSLIPIKPSPGDSLSKAEDAYRQMQKFLTSDQADKMIEGFDNIWIKRRDKKASDIRTMLTKFNNMLFKIGFLMCKACGGQGVVDYETCIECKGNRVIKRSFTYLDFETAIVRKQILKDFECDQWFRAYRDRKLVRNKGGNTFELGVDSIDAVEIGNFVETISGVLANQWMEKERKNSTMGASPFSYEGIKPKKRDDE